MIKKLRRKFILVATAATAVVLFSLVGIINVLNYVTINRSADDRLALLASSGGSFLFAIEDHTPPENEESADENVPEAEGKNERPDLPISIFDGKHGISRETPFEARYFSVTYENGQVSSVDLSRIATVDGEQALRYASRAQKKRSSTDYIEDFRYLKTTIDGRETILFLDCSRDLTTYRDFLLYSFLMSFAGLVVVFVLVFFFSKVVVKPIAESHEKQKRFITDASHELKTPLTIISANTEILEMDVGENEWTESIKNQVARLTEMTNNLVYLSRMQEADPRLNAVDFSLSDMVRESVAPYEVLARTKNQTLSYDVENGISYRGDTKAIKQALTMLFDNALKYSDEGGTVEVRLKMNGKNREIVVENTVETMEIGNHDELFERFARSDKSRNSKTGGSGIGLAVARAVVKAHGGKITAESPDGKSFVVKILL